MKKPSAFDSLCVTSLLTKLLRVRSGQEHNRVRYIQRLGVPIKHGTHASLLRVWLLSKPSLS